MQEDHAASYRENMCVLDNLPSGLSYGAIGCDFSVDASTIYILNEVSLDPSEVTG